MLLRLYWKGFAAPAYRERWWERLGIRLNPEERRIIWLHAVSVGEVQASELLIRQLLDDYPDTPILITTTTPTGASRVRALFGERVRHCYAPFDIPPVVRRFFQAINPLLLILVETEIWPNLIHQAHDMDVPVLLANARMSARSAKRYQLLPGLTGETLKKIDMIAPQAESDAQRFIQLGAETTNVQVVGSIKFDIKLTASQREQSDVLRRIWGVERPVWIAASTHEGEEEQILSAQADLLAAIPEALLVLVPRHPERFDRVAELVEERGFSLVRRSSGKACEAKIQVYLGDSMGELPLFFGAVDLAFIGGSLVPHGGHNLLEAAVQGVPVLFGPHMFNFADICDLFLQQQAAVKISSPAELAETLQVWISDPSERSRYGENGRKLVESNRGALDRLLSLVKALISNGRAVKSH
jgi:3-deoxy-D-manno-octulosonic-acid transferase